MGKRKSKGIEAFEAFYSEAFGERWAKLKNALLAPKKHVAFLNPYYAGDKLFLENATEVADLPGCYEASLWGAPPRDENNLKAYYLLDAASVVAALALKVEEGDQVLDLCAAPGGKSFILATCLGETGVLTSNDRSATRRGRLKNVLKDYLPEVVHERLKVTGHDASCWCLHEKDAYDRILLDAPCSSERHVLESPKHLEEWAPGRTKRLAANQWPMLASALDVLKPGGTMVYSTCALSPLENDEVVAKLYERRKDLVEHVDIELPFGEETEYGWRMLPDHGGWGPFYLAVIKKRA